MKKLKLIVINIIIIVLAFLLFDFLYFKFIFNDYKKNCEKEGIPVVYNGHYKTYDRINKEEKGTTNIYKYFLENHLYQDVIRPQNNANNGSIILFGDSYTWLHNDVGLQKQLSDYENSIVYNFAFWGWGTQHMYYLINNPKLYEIISESGQIPKVAIYTYIRDHKNRLYDVMDYFLDIEPYLNYKIINGKLVQQNKSKIKSILYRLFSYRYLRHKINISKGLPLKDKYELIYNLVAQSYFELKKHYPDIKFIIFEYYQEKEIIPEEEDMFKRLEKLGIIYISTKDLTDEDMYNPKYTMEDKYHPNIEAWNVLCKPLSEKIEQILAEN